MLVLVGFITLFGAGAWLVSLGIRGIRKTAAPRNLTIVVMREPPKKQRFSIAGRN